MNDLVDRLRSRKGEAITRVEKLMDEAAVHIEAQNKLIEEMRGALQEGYGHISETARLMAVRGLRPDYPSLNQLCGKIADALSKSNPNTPERNDK